MTMQDQLDATPTPHKRLPWNKGKVTGAKPPLRPKHVWSIRTKLQIEGRARDLAMFNLAIDSKLRGCDVVAIKVEDVAASGYTADRATVRQKKTGRPVRFELTEQTRQAVDDYLKAAGKKPGEFLSRCRQHAPNCGREHLAVSAPDLPRQPCVRRLHRHSRRLPGRLAKTSRRDRPHQLNRTTRLGHHRSISLKAGIR